MNREEMLTRIQDFKGSWDVIVIGGGAGGLGVALDAVSRGYKTLLLEKTDFSQGTSSRSTKLIHGGVRYLRQGQLSFVYSSLQERALLLRNAPHLVHSLPFILLASSYSSLLYYTMGIKLYDMLAGRFSIGTSEILSKVKVKNLAPTLKENCYAGGIKFYDGQFDDARLAVNLAQTITELNGVVLNYVSVVNFLKEKGKIVGVQAYDAETQKHYEIYAKVVVNATGTFVDKMRNLDDPNAEASLMFNQGAHIVLDRSFFPGDAAVVIPKTSDGRILFIIPWHNRVLVGTTETAIEDVPLEPKPKQEEIEFLLEHTDRYLIRTPVLSDIQSAFAGVRALVKPRDSHINSSSVTREHSLLVSHSNLVSLAGGKWTGFRKMGEDTIDIAAKVGRLTKRSSKTEQLHIHGWEQPCAHSSEWQYYGSDASLVEKLGEKRSELLERLHPSVACRSVDVIWAVRHEMARQVEDVLARRNRSLLLDAKSSSIIATQVAALMAKELGKDSAWETAQVGAYQTLAKNYSF